MKPESILVIVHFTLILTVTFTLFNVNFTGRSRRRMASSPELINTKKYFTGRFIEKFTAGTLTGICVLSLCVQKRMRIISLS